MHLTEARLIGISWIAQYLPWVLFPILTLPSKDEYIVLLIVLVSLSTFFMFTVFSDPIDRKIEAHHAPFRKIFIKSPFTLTALLFAQLAFWIPFESIEFMRHSKVLFFLVGFGATFGTVLSLWYRKTPHTSVVTFAYGWGFMLSVSTLIYLFTTGESIPLGLQMILISSLGGFYLPFVFDIVIRKTVAEQRGTMFACAEVVQSISSIFGMTIATFFGNMPLLLLSIISIFFIVAILLQLKEDKRR